MNTSLSDLDANLKSPGMSTLNGFNHIAMMQRGSIDHITMMLTGLLDYDLRCAFYYAHKDEVYALYVRDLMIPEVTEALERTKRLYRDRLRFAMDEEARVEKAARQSKKEAQFSKAAVQFKAMSTPAPEGTVDELCKKYGVSKSHVRMLKRENRLNELTKLQENHGEG